MLQTVPYAYTLSRHIGLEARHLLVNLSEGTSRLCVQQLIPGISSTIVSIPCGHADNYALPGRHPSDYLTPLANVSSSKYVHTHQPLCSLVTALSPADLT